MSGAAVYEVERLTKRYRRAPRPANDDISFSIPAGQFFGIFGPNGAGKTTLVRQLTALLQPTSGSITLFGHDVVQHPDRVSRWVGYYGQKIAALRHFKLQEVLAITGILRGLPVAEARRQANALIERFELEPLANHRLSRLSGGEQRLAVLLATFVGQPPVLVLDEPTNELDPIRRRTLWEYLGAYTAQHGATVVLTTHNLTEAEGIVERVALIDGGKLVVVATPGELKRQIADQVRLDVTLRLSHISHAERRLASLPGSRQIRSGRWEIVAPQDQATALLPQVVQLVGIESIDDFRLITPTLEDVYVHFTGRAWRHDEPEG